MLPNINIHSRNERKGYNKIQYEKHLYRVSEALPIIHTNNNKKLDFNDEIASIDSKWKQCNTFRIKCIQEENKEILFNLAKAYQKSNIDNKLPKSIEYVREFKKNLFVSGQKIKINKINKENKELLKRIQNVKSSFY